MHENRAQWRQFAEEHTSDVDYEAWQQAMAETKERVEVAKELTGNPHGTAISLRELYDYSIPLDFRGDMTYRPGILNNPDAVVSGK
ncbi:MAG: hypothetical protein MHM6MM_008749 [Cercozoa sp. M6MM]